MSMYDEVQTIQYLGNKNRLLDDLCKAIESQEDIDTVVDLFAGTGSVGFALKNKYKIVSNDIEYYSYLINKAILNGCSLSDRKLNSIMEDAKERLSLSCDYLAEEIAEEERYLNNVNSINYNEYALFSKQTPSVFNKNEEIPPKMSKLKELVSMVKPGAADQEVPFPCLFITYYSNAYFGIKQCCQIDALATAISNNCNESQKSVLLTALMSAMSYTASTTTHFAQFLTVKSESTFKNIAEKRSKDIFEEFVSKIKELRERELLRKSTKKCECYNLDYLECLNKIQPCPSTIVYADPPYFKEHYSRYYHILNTLCLYDYPGLAVNPQRKQLSVGRYREDRNSSDFGKKAYALKAFEKMISECSKKEFSLVVSYSDNSIVKIDDLKTMVHSKILWDGVFLT